MSKQTPAIVSIPALVPVAKAVAGAYKKAESAQIAIGKAIIKAAETVTAEQVETFVKMVREQLADVLAEGSLKVEATRIRRVMACLIGGDIEPSDGATLRELYAACPKDAAKGGRKSGAKLPNPADDESDDDGYEEITPTKTVADKADAFKAAVTTLFGYAEPELVAAMQYATAHAGLFMQWASASARAAQMAELEKAVVAKPVVKTTGKRKPRTETATA